RGRDLRGALGALQEGVGRLRVRTGGRVGQAVQVLLDDGVADEVLDPLVPVGHADEAGRSEVPLQADVDVVRLERHQLRVLRGTGGAELFAVQDRTTRVARTRTGVQVAVRRTGDGLAERRAALQVSSEVDAEVQVRQDVAVAVGLAERLRLATGLVAEVVVRKPQDLGRNLDDRGRGQVGPLVAQAGDQVGREVAQHAVL